MGKALAGISGHNAQSDPSFDFGSVCSAGSRSTPCDGLRASVIAFVAAAIALAVALGSPLCQMVYDSV